MQEFTTINDSRQVHSWNQGDGVWRSRLYVNHGETACQQSAEHKTRHGAAKWARSILKIGV